MAIFNKQNKVEVAKPKTAKKGAEEISIANLEGFAALTKVSKALKTVEATMSAALKIDINDVFIGQGIQFSKRPDNFKGIDGMAAASCQLKALPSTSGISVENQERLKKAGIPLKEIDTVTETFILNPKYAENAEVMNKMEKALAKLGLPEDLFLHQSNKRVVCDGDVTIDAIFNIKNASGDTDRALILEMLPLVTTMAIKPTTSMSIKEAFATVVEFVGELEEVAEAE
jgi:hypothetical protein